MKKNYTQIKVAVDAGHGYKNTTSGGFDPGIEAGGMRECDIALQWALTIKYILGLEGIQVYLTRTDNTMPAPVWLRDDWAAEHGCDLFLSIHTNGSDGRASGVETFIRDEGDRAWGEMVLRCGVQATGLKSRGVKRDSESQHSKLAVLNFGPPATLLETGFLDRLTDRSIIAMTDTRVLFARKLAAAIKEKYPLG